MDILKRALAPISELAWEEIEKQSTVIFTSNLTGRKVVDLSGPHGWDYGSVSTGRLEVLEDQTEAVKYGIKQVQPLIETRIPFKLKLWELDNISKGAKDTDLGPLEDAAHKIASFEDKIIFEGLDKACILGLKNNSGLDKVAFPESIDDLLSVIAKAINQFKHHSIEGPYSLLLCKERWEKISGYIKGYPLRRHIEELIGGSIIDAPYLKGESYLISERGGDFNLTLGQDLSIGYEGHSSTDVTLYFTESFTFEIYEPKAVVVIE